MDREESPQMNKRTTRRSSSSTPNSKSTGEASNTTTRVQSSSVSDLAFGNESITLDELINSFPGRRVQILQFVSLLGPLSSPTIPLFIYGGASTGKTSVLLQIFKHLNWPFIYCSCVTCYSPRILFESILNQLLLHRKNETNGYLSAKRYEKLSDFINLLHEVLSTYKKSASGVNEKMVYLVVDNIELVREWDKCPTILLPFLFNLYEILKMSDVGLIFVSKTSSDTFPSDTGYVEHFPVYFPEYTEDDLRQIFMKKQENPKLYSSFLEITRQIDELSTAFSPLFKKYCEPLDDLGTVPSEDMKRKLFGHLKPFISISLNETFSFPSQLVCANQEKTNRKSISKKLGVDDFLMVTSIWLLLQDICLFLHFSLQEIQQHLMPHSLIQLEDRTIEKERERALTNRKNIKKLKNKKCS